MLGVSSGCELVVPPLLTPDEGPSLETAIFPLSFQVVREPLPFAYVWIKIALKVPIKCSKFARAYSSRNLHAVYSLSIL